jgi:type I restriction enzyme S subunit
MPNNWKTYKLEELTTKLGDGLHGTPKYSEFGEYYFINGNNLTNGKIEIKKDTKKVIYEEFLKHKKDLNENTLFVSINGTIGNVGTYNGEKVILGKSACYFNIKEGVDKEFIKQIFSSKLSKDYLENNATGTTIQNVSLKTMREFPINLPSLHEQQSIASILSAIDDKIENNLAINKTLEEMAMALYKHWFVDFGPFKDGEFVESELGLIPKGWEVKRLDEVFNITIGRTPPRKEPKWFSQNEGVKWISIKDLGNSGIYISETSEYLSEEAIKKFNVPVIKPNTVLLSFKLTVGRVAISSERMLSNEAIAHLNRKDNTLPVEFVFSYLKLFDYNSLGSTSSIATAVNTQTIKAMKIIIPDTNQLEDYFEKVNSFFEQIKSNQSENQYLTQLRDTLLPKLISGEVRLKEFREN